MSDLEARVSIFQAHLYFFSYGASVPVDHQGFCGRH